MGFYYETKFRVNEIETDSKKRNSRSAIDAQLREDHTGYTFSELADRFADALAEAIEYGDDYVTIKIPSGSEFSAGTEYVAAALGRSIS